MPPARPGRAAGAAHGRIAAEFDAKAPVYERNRLSGWYKAQAGMVLEVLDPPPGFRGTVLDVGCATGWFLRQLAARCREARGIGVDISAGMIRVAEQHAAGEGTDGQIAFLAGDWESPDAVEAVIRHAPEGVDAVVCTSALHYFLRPAEAVRRMRDCLAPGGRLIVVERATASSLPTRIWDKLHRYWIRDQVRFHDQQEILSMLGRAGLDSPHIVSELQRYFWQGKLYTSLAVFQAMRRKA